MNKLEFNNKLETLISSYESEEVLSLNERILRLKEVITVSREYNSIYKNPYKHQFMGKPIKYSDTLIDMLEEIVIQAEEVQKINQII